MRFTASTRIRSLWAEQKGNTIILMTFTCILLLFVCLGALDIFSILIIRHYAQTDADAAVSASVIAIQPIVTKALIDDAKKKVEKIMSEGTAEYKKILLPSQTFAEFMRDKLEAEGITEPSVVDWLLKETETAPKLEVFVQEVLTDQEIGCTIERVSGAAEAKAQSIVEQLVRLPKPTATVVKFPYTVDRPWIVVRVTREIPTTLISPKGPMRVTVTSAATLLVLKDMRTRSCH